jgi:hypothetical protein
MKNLKANLPGPDPEATGSPHLFAASIHHSPFHFRDDLTHHNSTSKEQFPPHTFISNKRERRYGGGYHPHHVN